MQLLPQGTPGPQPKRHQAQQGQCARAAQSRRLGRGRGRQSRGVSRDAHRGHRAGGLSDASVPGTSPCPGRVGRTCAVMQPRRKRRVNGAVGTAREAHPRLGPRGLRGAPAQLPDLSRLFRNSLLSPLQPLPPPCRSSNMPDLRFSCLEDFLPTDTGAANFLTSFGHQLELHLLSGSDADTPMQNCSPSLHLAPSPCASPSNLLCSLLFKNCPLSHEARASSPDGSSVAAGLRLFCSLMERKHPNSA